MDPQKENQSPWNSSIESNGEDHDMQSFFGLLPWQDILFTHVFKHLTIVELFRLRTVSRCSHQCLNEYFTSCPIVDLREYCDFFTKEAFSLVTHRNYKLRELLLRRGKGWLSDDVLIPAFSSSSHITKVDLTSCTALSHRSILALASVAPELQDLCLAECPWMTGDAAATLVKSCPDLRRLDLTGCWGLQDETVISIAVFCQDIIYLSIAKIYGITDDAIQWIAKNCRKLQHINLYGCWRVTDYSVKLLGEYCRDLRTLQVKDCRYVTDISLAKIRIRGVEVDVPQHPWRLNPETENLLQSLKLHVQI